jgi:cobalt transporter subunit CbtA
MAVFRRLVLVALCAGLLSGVFATAAHQIGTVPVILKAEIYEKAAEHVTAEAHEHAAAWEPENGAERTVYTLVADVLTGIGFALLLAAGFTLHGGAVAWREGLFWGLAGFATFTIAPGLGLPPEVPGTEAAPLLDRQLWWLATAVSTGGGLALLAFTRRAPWAILAAFLIVLPHLYGAPQPAPHAAAAPEALARQFVVAVTIVSFLFWLILGALTGYFYGRFQPRISSGSGARALDQVL